MANIFCTPKGTNIGNNIYKLGDKYYKVIRVVTESKDTNVNEILFSFLTNGFIDSNDFNKILPYLVFSEFNDKEEIDVSDYKIIEITMDKTLDSINVQNEHRIPFVYRHNMYFINGVKKDYLPLFDKKEMGISALFNSNDNGNISKDEFVNVESLIYAFNYFCAGETGDNGTIGYASGKYSDLCYYYENYNFAMHRRIYFNERTYFLLLMMYYTSGIKLSEKQLAFILNNFGKYIDYLDYTRQECTFSADDGADTELALYCNSNAEPPMKLEKKEY